MQKFAESGRAFSGASTQVARDRVARLGCVKAGCWSRQTAIACGQRVWKRHPEGGFRALGMLLASPPAPSSRPDARSARRRSAPGCDAARGRWQQPDRKAAERGLAAAGFANQAERLARVDAQPHVVHRRRAMVWRSRLPTRTREVFGQAGSLDQRRGLRLAMVILLRRPVSPQVEGWPRRWWRRPTATWRQASVRSTRYFEERSGGLRVRRGDADCSIYCLNLHIMVFEGEGSCAWNTLQPSLRIGAHDRTVCRTG